MASTFTTSLRLEKQGLGDHKSTWGTFANNTFDMLDGAIAGYDDIALPDSDTTLSVTDGIDSPVHSAMINFTGALTIDRTVTFPGVSKTYIAKNSTTGGKSVIFKVGSSTYTLVNGQTKLIYTNGTTVWTNDTLAGTSSSPTSRFNISPFVDAAGIMDIGSTIDFHSLNADANDYASRLALSGSDLFLTPFGSSARKMWNDSNLSYVETSWTPSLLFSGNAVGMTYFTRSGRTVRIGNAMLWDFSIILSAKGSSVGLATVSGFPVAPATIGAGAAFAYNSLVAAGMVVGTVQGTSISLSYAAATFSSTMSDANFSNASQLQMAGWYRI